MIGGRLWSSSDGWCWENGYLTTKLHLIPEALALVGGSVRTMMMFSRHGTFLHFSLFTSRLCLYLNLNEIS